MSESFDLRRRRRVHRGRHRPTRAAHVLPPGPHAALRQWPSRSRSNRSPPSASSCSGCWPTSRSPSTCRTSTRSQLAEPVEAEWAVGAIGRRLRQRRRPHPRGGRRARRDRRGGQPGAGRRAGRPRASRITRGQALAFVATRGAVDRRRPAAVPAVRPPAGPRRAHLPAHERSRSALTAMAATGRRPTP